jgi:hypothetical protein
MSRVNEELYFPERREMSLKIKPMRCDGIERGGRGVLTMLSYSVTIFRLLHSDLENFIFAKRRIFISSHLNAVGMLFLWVVVCVEYMCVQLSNRKKGREKIRKDSESDKHG